MIRVDRMGNCCATLEMSGPAANTRVGSLGLPKIGRLAGVNG
jgi:hypothetical protein